MCVVVGAVKANQGLTVDSVKLKQAVVQQIEETKSATISGEKVNFDVKRGVIPAIKGAGAGLAGGAVGAAGTAAVVLLKYYGTAGEGPAFAFLGAVYAGRIGAVAGAVVGGVVANITDNKLAGTLAGAGAGAVTGAIMGIKDGNNIIVSAIIGAGAGAGAGYAGSLVATKK